MILYKTAEIRIDKKMRKTAEIRIDRKNRNCCNESLPQRIYK